MAPSRRTQTAIADMTLAEIRIQYFAADSKAPPASVRAALRADSRAGAAALGRLAESRARRRRSTLERRRELVRRETELWNAGLQAVAGVDEAGMGPLAGPVVAAAVILPPFLLVDGLDDSKVLLPAHRQALFETLQQAATGIGIGLADAGEVDHINIYQAGLLAMRRAVRALPLTPEHILVDARRIPGQTAPQEAIIHGDARSASIAAASIIAKVTRDRIMEDYHCAFPDYDFARHKGYATAAHRQAVRLHGPSPVHRKSFLSSETEPVQGKLFGSPGNA